MLHEMKRNTLSNTLIIKLAVAKKVLAAVFELQKERLPGTNHNIIVFPTVTKLEKFKKPINFS